MSQDLGGDEWLAIKIYHLQAFLNKRKEASAALAFLAGSPAFLQAQSCALDEREPESLKGILEDILHQMSGRDVMAVSLPALALFEKPPAAASSSSSRWAPRATSAKAMSLQLQMHRSFSLDAKEN